MPHLEIKLLGHLLIAGNSTGELGLDAATARRYEDGGWVPCIPATALRGALRIQLEALLRGQGRPVTGPYAEDAPDAPADTGKPAEPGRTSGPDDVVGRLFGHGGPELTRTGGRDGQLRFSDALPADPEAARRALQVRAGIEVDNYTGSVAAGKLFFQEVLETSAEPLVFVAEVEPQLGTAEADLEILRRALAVTTEIGGDKARGGGEVELTWLDDPEGGPGQARDHDAGPSSIQGQPAAGSAQLTLTLLEPAHFGDGGPRGNYHRTRSYIPGSTVRGAVAWALIRAGKADSKAPAADFRALFVEDTRASFGDALPSSGSGTPRIRPATRRKARAGTRREDLLAHELARQAVNQRLAGSGRYLGLEFGDLRPDPEPARDAEGLLRRARTRLSIDRFTGTAAEGRLFSFEQIEAWAPPLPGETSQRTRFVSRIEGLTAEAAALLAQVAEVPVYVGAGRNHGLGKVGIKLSFEPAAADALEEEVDRAVARVHRLADAVAEQTIELEALAGLEPTTLGADALLPLALVGTSLLLPEENSSHPLSAFPEAGEPVRCFLASEAFGGYDQRPENSKGKDGPLKTLRRAVGAGSVYVYQIPQNQLRELLGQALPALRHGVGRNRESGCGRFEVFEEMS